MLNILWDTRNYFFWLTAISLLCFVLERVRPWRREQAVLRKMIWQDLFWLVFNGHYAGIVVAFVATFIIDKGVSALAVWPYATPDSLQLLTSQPLWIQFVFFLFFKDFLEYGVHNLLHRVPRLWEFHKLHHSIEELDWIGNMRFHWMEIVVYKGLTYLPLVILGISGDVILWVAITSTLIGHLNHSNLNLDWGPFRKLLNSPNFHVWHHDIVPHGRGGQNFGVVFSLWDWLFHTAYRPGAEQPDQLGFVEMGEYPNSLPARFVYPFWKRRNPVGTAPGAG